MIVLPTGPTNSPRLMLVGEAPGVEEEKAGKPFVGASGFLLNQMLANAGIVRTDCYITNVSQVRPPANDFGAMYYEDKKRLRPNEALLECRSRLWKEVAQVNPKVIILFGREAMNALMQQTDVSNYRGMIYEHLGFRFMPTWHPAYLLRGNYAEKTVVEADLKKAHRQAISPFKPEVRFNFTPTFDEVMEFLATRHPRYTVDIETIKNTIRCIGLGWSIHDAISIPILKGHENYWSLEQETQILIQLDRLFRDRACEFVLQNGPYDLTILARDFGLEILNYKLDNMFAQHLLSPEHLKGLAFQCSLYTDHHMYWANTSKDADNREYNCYDCIVTFQAALEIDKELDSRKLRPYYESIIHPAISALTRVQSRGVLIDEIARKEIADQCRLEMGQAQQQIDSLLGRALNPSSPKQVGELIYNEWKLPKQKKRGMTKATTDEDALLALGRRPEVRSDPKKSSILTQIISFRQKRVLLSTFAEMVLSSSGRVHTSYNLAGTVTGRISSSATFDGIGGNLQNIPRGSFRRIFKADPGKVLIKADLSQAEYRVLIWKARIQRLIDKLTNDPTFSIHKWNAAENIFRVPYSQITKQMYDDSKNGVYGSNYGIGWLKVSRMYNIESTRAKFIIDRYHQAVPEIKNVYQAEIRAELESTRKLTNPLGRERIFFGRMDDDLFRQGYSHYCQSTVADLILAGLIDLDQAGVEVLLQVHDELIIQVPSDRESILQGAKQLKQALERPVQIPGVAQPLIIPAEVKVGPDWYNVKPVEDYLKGLLP